MIVLPTDPEDSYSLGHPGKKSSSMFLFYMKNPLQGLILLFMIHVLKKTPHGVGAKRYTISNPGDPTAEKISRRYWLRIEHIPGFESKVIYRGFQPPVDGSDSVTIDQLKLALPRAMFVELLNVVETHANPKALWITGKEPQFVDGESRKRFFQLLEAIAPEFLKNNEEEEKDASPLAA